MLILRFYNAEGERTCSDKDKDAQQDASRHTKCDAHRSCRAYRLRILANVVQFLLFIIKEMVVDISTINIVHSKSVEAEHVI